MKLIISGDNLPISQKIKDLAEKHVGQKIDKHLKNFDQGLKVAWLKITKGPRWGFSASLKIALPQKNIFAKSQDQNLLKTLTAIRDQAIKQIKEYKEKVKTRS
jgi:ribosomal subunit interface protein